MKREDIDVERMISPEGKEEFKSLPYFDQLTVVYHCCRQLSRRSPKWAVVLSVLMLALYGGTLAALSLLGYFLFQLFQELS
jgi:hypothetical protein